MRHQLIRKTTAIVLAGLMLTSTAYGASAIQTVDPQSPYDPPVSGLFHDQSLDGDNAGEYTVYISPDFEPCSGAVLLLTPDDTTAEGFFASDIGQAWKTVIDRDGLALVVAEPENAGAWNTGDSPDARDDEAFLKALWDRMRSKSQELEAPFDMDERAVYLVGYEEGGAAAQEFAMEWPTLFAGVASVNASEIPEDVMQAAGEAYSYPFAQAENLDGRQEVQLRNRDIPVPVWLVGSEASDSNAQAVVSYWVDANDAAQAEANRYAQTVYENGEARVWVTGRETAGKITPQVLFDEFLSEVQRFVGDPGGRLAWTIDFANDGETGYFFYEKEIDGRMRRWMTYVPGSYTGEEAVPLVVATHGYSSSAQAFAGDTRWSDIAEQNGFIVVYTQAYPSDDQRGNIPVPYWNTMEKGELMEGLPDDVSYFRQMIADIEQQYNIDDSRLYATGHSNGSCMTWMLAMHASDLFAAVAPIGGHLGTHLDTVPEDAEPLPIWITLGDYDYEPTTGTDTGTWDALNYWTTYNGTDRQAEDSVDGRFTTHEYVNDQDIPLFRYTEIENSPHSYMPEVSQMVWDDFFSHFTLNNDGSRSYDGIQIERDAAFDDIDGHWAQQEIETAVATGLFSGASDTAFEPDVRMSRAMLTAVLYRLAGQPEAGDPEFTDVSEDAYYADAVAWAGENNIVTGYAADIFGPDDNITREQMAAILYRYAQHLNIDVDSAAAPDSLDGYTDAGQISEYARPAMAWANAAGFIRGENDTTLNPGGYATRAEAAAILMRFCENTDI
nr:S-layer homology domain-containing protein [uncultured Agathobaculum sp.]